MKEILVLAFLCLIQAFLTRGIIAQEIETPVDSNRTYLVETFREYEIVFQTNNIQIGGTLTVPDHLQTEELVILCSGSGPQDRDETLFGFPVFKVITQHLGTEGIASFRYDDRGVGQSTGDFVNSTLSDHTDDLLDIVDYFKKHEFYPFENFILLGHSQGGIVTAKSAVNNDAIKKLILMSSPAVPLVEVVTAQIRQESKEKDLPPSLAEIEVSAHNQLMRALYEKRNTHEAVSNFKKISKLILYHTDPDTTHIDALAEKLTGEYHIVYGLPSLTSFLYHDPASDLSQLKIPVLSLFAGKDIQVTVEQNKDRMENAFLSGGNKYQFITFDGANHFFQEAKSGDKSEYETLDKEFTDGFLTEISNWIKGCDAGLSCKRDSN